MMLCRRKIQPVQFDVDRLVIIDIIDVVHDAHFSISRNTHQGHRVKFLISFLRIDTTVDNGFSVNSSALSFIFHEYVSTDTPDYQDCSNSREIEAAFEAKKNYAEDGESLLCPEGKIKVLRIEPVPDLSAN
jgi:hypothetical protein